MDITYSKRHLKLPKLLVIRSLLKFRSSLFKGLQFPKAEPLVAVRRRRNTLAYSPLQGVNSKTVRWTVFEEGTLWQKASLKNEVRVYKNSDWAKINVVYYNSGILIAFGNKIPL